jgi:alkylated DNA repair dioxygenase AlkB
MAPHSKREREGEMTNNKDHAVVEEGAQQSPVVKVPQEDQLSLPKMAAVMKKQNASTVSPGEGKHTIKREAIPNTNTSSAASNVQPITMPIPGLFLVENFISEEEEQLILKTLDDSSRNDFLRWNPSKFNGTHFGKRWGVHCNLRTRTVTPPEHPMPRFIHDILIPKLQALNIPAIQKTDWIPNEANAIDYRRKQGHVLKSHVDNRQLSKEPIANLSLAGDCYMTFCNEKIKCVPPLERKVLLKRRCLQVLTGEARYDYSHGIHNQDLLSDRRVSLTMRESPLTQLGGTTALSTTRHFHQSIGMQPTLNGLLGKRKSP